MNFLSSVFDAETSDNDEILFIVVEMNQE